MLRKERELEEARKKLAQIRQQQYKFLPSELREDEGWLAERACAVRVPHWWGPRVTWGCCRCKTGCFSLIYPRNIQHLKQACLVRKNKCLFPVVYLCMRVCVCCVYVFVSEWHRHSEFGLEEVVTAVTISKWRQYDSCMINVSLSFTASQALLTVTITKQRSSIITECSVIVKGLEQIQMNDLIQMELIQGSMGWAYFTTGLHAPYYTYQSSY